MARKRHVLIKMKDKKYTATACGFDFVEGECKTQLVVDTPGSDTVALDNVKNLFAGTTVKLGEYVDKDVEPDLVVNTGSGSKARVEAAKSKDNDKKSKDDDKKSKDGK